MSVTPETQAAAVANALINLAAALNGIQQQINTASAQWTNLSVANKLQAFPTTALLASGALGTADVSPVQTNPIDTRVATGSDISRPISYGSIAGLLTYLQGVSTAIGGGAVSANGAAVQLVALTL
jgi:hypothetical protein